MNVDEFHMKKCLSLAKKGLGNVAPNPMVGSILVYEEKIIGEGFTSPYGGNHAEVNCIKSVHNDNKHLIKKSTLYVSLEPCSHYGKTPPCTDLIIKSKIPKVVIGCLDPYKLVNGQGINHLRDAKIKVVTGVLEKESLEMNRRFFTFHTKNRPYIILKWAQTKDNFIDIDRTFYTNNNNWITTPQSKKLVHKWRSEEQAIMIGTNTATNDNPQLTVREVTGRNPLRVILDLNCRLPKDLNVFDQSTPTLIFSYNHLQKKKNLEFVKLDPEKELLPQLLNELYRKEIQSIIIEGGARLTNTFLTQNLWDEARVFIGIKEFKSGIKAPLINKAIHSSEKISTDILNIYRND